MIGIASQEYVVSLLVSVGRVWILSTMYVWDLNVLGIEKETRWHLWHIKYMYFVYTYYLRLNGTHTRLYSLKGLI